MPENGLSSHKLPAIVASRLGSDVPRLCKGQERVTSAARRTPGPFFGRPTLTPAPTLAFAPTSAPAPPPAPAPTPAPGAARLYLPPTTPAPAPGSEGLCNFLQRHDLLDSRGMTLAQLVRLARDPDEGAGRLLTRLRGRGHLQGIGGLDPIAGLDPVGHVRFAAGIGCRIRSVPDRTARTRSAARSRLCT